MDWGKLFKDFPLLIPAIGAIVVAILTFIFNRWNSTHNKNLDIQKKHFDKRMALRDEKIKEIREFIKSYNLTNDNLYRAASSLISEYQNKDGERFKREANEYKSRVSESKMLMVESKSKVAGITYLDDEILGNLITQFLTKSIDLINEADITFQALLARETSELEARIEKLGKLLDEVDTLVLFIYGRLDELALMDK
jgi:hypothetical protein